MKRYALAAATVVVALTALTAPAGASHVNVGVTRVSVTSLETGQEFTASARGAVPTVDYVLVVGTSAANCAHSDVVLTGPVTADYNGRIAPTTAELPTSVTPGTRYLCWVSTDGQLATAPAAVVVF
jgi:hypothetical protein